MSLTITTPGGTSTLSCPKTSPGVAVTVFGQVSFSPVSSFAETLTLSITAPTSNDTIKLLGYSLQASLISTGPTIIADGSGVINGGSYRSGQVVSGSWVAIKGSGFTDPGVTTDWSNSDFSKGLPTILRGVQVLFNDQPGAMWYLIDGATQQINVQAPANLSGPVSVRVVRNGVTSNAVTTTAVQVAPGIFSYSPDAGRTFYPAAVLS